MLRAIGIWLRSCEPALIGGSLCRRLNLLLQLLLLRLLLHLLLLLLLLLLLQLSLLLERNGCHGMLCPFQGCVWERPSAHASKNHRYHVRRDAAL